MLPGTATPQLSRELPRARGTAHNNLSQVEVRDIRHNRYYRHDISEQKISLNRFGFACMEQPVRGLLPGLGSFVSLKTMPAQRFGESRPRYTNAHDIDRIVFRTSD
jgi:hypothetical protein